MSSHAACGRALAPSKGRAVEGPGVAGSAREMSYFPRPPSARGSRFTRSTYPSRSSRAAGLNEYDYRTEEAADPVRRAPVRRQNAPAMVAVRPIVKSRFPARHRDLRRRITSR